MGRIRESREPYGFAPLRKRAIAGTTRLNFSESGETEDFLREKMFQGRSERGFCEPIEIRVSADAIIEVHSVSILARSPSLYRSSMQLRSRRAARAIVGYALFGAAAALVIWFLLK